MEQEKKSYHAPMHTLEHLLSGTVDRIYGCGRPVTTHIERKKSKVDFRFPGVLTREELDRIEEQVNRTIALGLEVTEEFMDRESAGREFSLDRLPEEAGDRIRIVRIGDYDACPCIGEHVANTSELAPLKIISADGDDSTLRIRFRFDKQADQKA